MVVSPNFTIIKVRQQAMQQMLLPLAIIAMGSALLPGKIPETDTDPVPYPDGKEPTKLTKFKPSWYPT